MRAIDSGHAHITLLPPNFPDCWLFPEFLSEAECEAEIAAAQQRGFEAADRDFPPTYRNNRRQVLDDTDTAQRLYARLLDRLPASALQRCDDAARRWRMSGINPRLRYCQYLAHQAFFLHQDGVRYAADGSRSFLTFMIYLDDPSTFEGGATRFFRGGPGSGFEHAAEAILALRPPRGSLIVFDHALWHDGAEVLSGRKHILRSDLMFVAEEANAPLVDVDAHAESLHSEHEPFTPGHSGYVWAIQKLLDGRIASAGRDTHIRLWAPSGQADAHLEGHAQSVLAMAEPTPGTLASLSRDRQLIWWDLASHREMARCEAHDGSGLALAATGDGRLFSAGADGRLRRWEAPAVAGPADDTHRGWIWDLAILRDAAIDRETTRTLVLCAAEDGTVRIHDADTLELLEELRHPCALRALAVASAGSDIGLVCGDIEGQTHRWRYDGQWRYDGAQPRHRAAIRRLRWLDDGRLVSVGEDGDVVVDTAVDRPASHPHGDVGFRCIAHHLNFATDVLDMGDHRVLSSGYDGHLRISHLDEMTQDHQMR
jgi:WD40 repeat protein